MSRLPFKRTLDLKGKTRAKPHAAAELVQERLAIPRAGDIRCSWAVRPCSSVDPLLRVVPALEYLIELRTLSEIGSVGL